MNNLTTEELETYLALNDRVKELATKLLNGYAKFVQSKGASKYGNNGNLWHGFRIPHECVEFTYVANETVHYNGEEYYSGCGRETFDFDFPAHLLTDIDGYLASLESAYQANLEKERLAEIEKKKNEEAGQIIAAEAKERREREEFERLKKKYES